MSPPFSLKMPISIPDTANTMSTHSLGLCLSESGVIFISFLRDGLAEHKIFFDSLYFQCFTAVTLLSSLSEGK